MNLKNIVVVLFFILILLTSGVEAEDYTIDGDVVYIDDDNVYMSATPHTIASSGWVYFDLTSKQYSGDIDVVWGFNTAVSKPTRAEVYAPHWVNTTTENEHTFYNVSDFSLYYGDDLDYGNLYNNLKYQVTHEVAIWNYNTDEIEGYETVISNVGFDVQVSDGDDYTAYWETRNDKLVLWKDKTSTFELVTHDYQGFDKWYYIKDVNVNAGQEYTLRAWIEIPVSLEPQSGKYYYAAKPSDETIPEAIASGHFYALDPWWEGSWNLLKTIDLNQSMIDQGIGAGGFPVLVSITDSDLADHAQIDGDDIVFVDSTNTTQLPHEIEFWNKSTGVLVAWVNVTDITNVNSINMYYNNSEATNTEDPEGVWDDNFVLVQHLSETPPGTTVDSTSHNHNGTTTGMDSADQIAGQIDGGLDFEGLAAYISVDDGDALDFEGASESFTLSLWTVPGVTNYYQAFMMKGDLNNDFWRLVLKNTGVVGCSADSIDFNSVSTLDPDTLYYITGVFDKDGNGQIYIDGLPDGTPVALNNEVFAISTQDTHIGGASYTTATEQNYEGMLDEARISNIPRSAAWTITDYNTSKYPELFISVGAEQSDTPDSVKYYSNASETFAFIDTVYVNKIVAGVNYSINNAETITTTDGIEISKIVASINYSIDNTDTITITDTVTLIKTVASIFYNLYVEETITITDSVSITKIVAPIIYEIYEDEIITITDNIDVNKILASVMYYANISDAVVFTDSIAVITTIAPVLYTTKVNDAITITDSVGITKTSAPILNKINISDTVGIADSVFIEKSTASILYTSNVSDTITFTDGVVITKTTASIFYTSNVSDTITMADGVVITKSTASTDYNVSISDTITFTDGVVITKTTSDESINITLMSFSPSPFNTNYTGDITISYMVDSTEPLNLSSIAFLYGLNYTIPAGGDMQNFISAPSNDIAYEGVYRAPHRNLTPYLSWEDNATITEGNVWKWGGYDNDSSRVSTSVINATHTWINVTGVTEDVLPSSFYISKTEMYDAPKTGFEVSRAQGLIFKMWNLEEIRGRSADYLANMYFDTSWESTEPTYPIEIGYCNASFNPDTDDLDTSPYCAKFGEWNGTRWVDHSWSPTVNASYASPLTINASQVTDPTPTDMNYVWLRSNTISSKSYILNATDYDPGITNITFAQTETMWTYNELNGVSTAQAYTPSYFTTYARDDEEILHHLYIANDNGVWGHSEIFSESIGVSSVPVSPVNFEYFNVTCEESYYDYEMDATYDQGTVGVGIYCPADPDNTIVSHNLTLHYYPNMTLVATVNDTFTTDGTEEVEIEFNTAPYYSSDTLYTLKCVSTDGDDSVATKWMNSYFALDADGNRGWVNDSKLLFWGMNDIPTLYTEINDSSLISYDGGSDIYTMHIPFFKSKANDTFYFNETVHLESLNDEDVSYFRFSGITVFDYATILGWDTVEDSPAPVADTYRAYVYSLTKTCGNITNSNFSYLGSDFYRQEGLNFVSNDYTYLIHNSTFSHNAEGPIFEECNDVTISNCMINDNVNVGVGVYFSHDFIIENNTISSNGGRGVTLYEADDNIVRYNDITDSGVHGIHLWSNSNNNTCTGNDITGSSLYDYYLSSYSTGNFILNPGSLTDKIRVTSTSSVNIENSDNMAFSEDSLATSYAYLTNFSMYVSGTSQTFDITQRDIGVWPTTDRVKISNLEWNSIVALDSDSDIAINPTWFNITNGAWADSDVLIYRDNVLQDNISAEGNGSISYYYEETFSGAPYFEFRITLLSTPLLFNLFFLLTFLALGLTGYSVLFNDTTNFTHIITGFLSAILWFILGYQSYIGIGFDHAMTDSVYHDGALQWTEKIVEVTTYQYAWMSMLFIVIGVMMVLYNIVQAYNANRDMIKQLEGEKND